jgi:hypothetical protein
MLLLGDTRSGRGGRTLHWRRSAAQHLTRLYRGKTLMIAFLTTAL